MSYGQTSREFKLACAKAANMAGTASNTGEGGSVVTVRGGEVEYTEYLLTKPNGYLIAQFASGRWGVSVDYLLHCDAIEIKIGQGAKPGMGGHLMGEKVTEEIARARGIPVGTDCLSPARHLDVKSLDDLKALVRILRDVVDYEKPIGIKLGPGRVYKDVYMACQADVDYVAVDGKLGGTGASPDHVTQSVGLPTIAVIAPAVKAMKDAGVYGDVKLVVMGGIRNGGDVAKALALGAHAVAMASAIQIAAGCVLCGQCTVGKCPAGICTQDPELRKRFAKGKGVDEGARLIANFIRATTREVAQIAAALGHRSLAEFSREDVRAVTLEAAALAGVKLAGIDDYFPATWKKILED